MRNTVITGVCLALSLVSLPVWAQIAVSSNDHKMTQENGVTKNVVNPQPDSITIVDLGALPVKVLGTVDNVPGSVVGPPLSVAITPDESLALVASSSKFDPADPTKLAPDGKMGVATRNGEGKVTIVKLGGDTLSEAATLDVAPRPYAAAVTPDGKTAVVGSLGDPKGNGMLTAIDLTSTPPGKIVGTADIGHESLEGMMMSSDGKWIAGVAHAGSTRPKDAPQFKANGVVVLYKLDGGKLTKVSEAPIGAWSQGAAFSKDGKTLVVGIMIQRNMQVFKNDDGKLTDTGQTIPTGGGAAAVRASTGP